MNHFMFNGYRVFPSIAVSGFHTVQRMSPVFMVHGTAARPQFRRAFNTWLRETFGDEKRDLFPAQERTVLVMEKERAIFVHPSTFVHLRFANSLHAKQRRRGELADALPRSPHVAGRG